VANAFSNDVTVLEGTATVATITAGLQPWDIAVDTRSRRAYVANSGDGTITVIDTERNEVADTLIGLQEPWGVAVSADGSLYVADAATDELLHLSPNDGTILTRGRTGERPRGVALDEEAGRAYVANTETANVSVLSLSDLSPVATIEAGLAPLAVAVDPVRAQAYAVNSLSDDMTVIDTETATPVNTVDAGRKPWDLVVSEDGTVYVAASASGEILLFDASELTTAKSSP
jgi:YVTN family beta-propeller protein